MDSPPAVSGHYTGKIEKTETMDYQGKIDGMLEVMRQIVFIFAGKQPPNDKNYYTNRSNY